MKPTPGKTASYAWAVVIMLWPVAMLNYLDRQMVSTIRASIRADIPSIANDAQFGVLMAVFMWVYAFLSPVGGFVADRFNRRWTVLGSLLVWSAVTWLTGHAQTYNQMKFFRALMGISEAFYMPAALALIADYHRDTTRARAIGIHQSGIYAGLGLGGIGGYIAQTSTWRNCFTWFGAAGVIYSIFLFFVLKDAPDGKEPRKAGEKNPVTIGTTVGALFSSWAFWILVIYFTLPAIAGWATKNWLPTFLSDVFKLKEGPAGLSATGYIQIGSFAGVLIGGAMADRWLRFSVRGRIYASAIGVFLCVPALLGIGYTWSIGSAILFMLVFGLGWGIFDCNNMPILCQIARPEHRATGYGFMNLVSISTGAGATILLGWMRDQGISFSVAFAFSAAVALLSVGMILFVRPRTDLEKA
jgi:MFS transporter, Spinster family, sphingosine-1-phosphate transporter